VKTIIPSAAASCPQGARARSGRGYTAAAAAAAAAAVVVDPFGVRVDYDLKT